MTESPTFWLFIDEERPTQAGSSSEPYLFFAGFTLLNGTVHMLHTVILGSILPFTQCYTKAHE